MTDLPTTVATRVMWRDAAMQVLKAHDALEAVNLIEPASDPDSGLPYNTEDWLYWSHNQYKPAYQTWSATIDEFNRLTGSTSRHPYNFRPAAQAIIEETE